MGPAEADDLDEGATLAGGEFEAERFVEPAARWVALCYPLLTEVCKENQRTAALTLIPRGYDPLRRPHSVMVPHREENPENQERQ